MAQALMTKTAPVSSPVGPASGRRPLPPGWRWVMLGDACEVVQGFAFPQKYQGQPNAEVPFVKVSDMNSPGAEITVSSAHHTVSRSTLEEIGARAYPPGTVIFPKVGGALLTNKKRILGVTATFDNNVMGLVPRGIEPRWLYYWMRTIDLRILSNTQALPSIKKSRVERIVLAVPPADEQRRVVELLDRQMAALKRARAAAEQQLESARGLPARRLRSLLRDSPAWVSNGRPLEHLCEIVAKQVDPKVSGYGSLPHVNGTNLEPGTLRLANVKTAQEDRMTSGKYLFEAGDILYSKLRPYLRKATIVDFRGLCSADMYPLKVTSADVRPRFLAWILVGDDFTAYADAESRRARMPKLNRKQLLAWKCPLPALDVQDQIVQQMDESLSISERLCKSITEEIQGLSILSRTVLTAALGETR